MGKELFRKHRTGNTSNSINKEAITMINDLIDASSTEHITSVNVTIGISKNDSQAQLDQLNKKFTIK